MYTKVRLEHFFTGRTYTADVRRTFINNTRKGFQDAERPLLVAAHPSAAALLYQTERKESKKNTPPFQSYHG